MPPAFNNQYHRATLTVLNWRRLNASMKGRYASWKVESDASWTVNYWVVITHHNGRKVEGYGYPFERREQADECLAWWRDNGCQAVIKEVSNGRTDQSG